MQEKSFLTLTLGQQRTAGQQQQLSPPGVNPIKLLFVVTNAGAEFVRARNLQVCLAKSGVCGPAGAD
jgi:hypothetical protein